MPDGPILGRCSSGAVSRSGAIVVAAGPVARASSDDVLILDLRCLLLELFDVFHFWQVAKVKVVHLADSIMTWLSKWRWLKKINGDNCDRLFIVVEILFKNDRIYYTLTRHLAFTSYFRYLLLDFKFHGRSTTA